MRHPIESVLREIDSLPEAKTTVTLKVPDRLSLQGNSVPSDIALSILADRLLAKGYEPDGVEVTEDGQLVRCKPATAG
ncbi:MAG TPA: hypothetical protein VH988_16255 [Thermoanaerobaculia bacterium]|jgi:hypothetical protein|nr:hypothetical protein [Thermoanaerobaculia bacterium]